MYILYIDKIKIKHFYFAKYSNCYLLVYRNAIKCLLANYNCILNSLLLYVLHCPLFFILLNYSADWFIIITCLNVWPLTDLLKSVPCIMSSSYKPRSVIFIYENLLDHLTIYLFVLLLPKRHNTQGISLTDFKEV